MNDRERELIRLVVDGDIRKAQAQAKIILNETILKTQRIADELGLREGIDYFVIKDNCYV